MKELLLQSSLWVYADASELPRPDAELLTAAKQAAARAYAPYSGFKVGAAALLSDGRVVVGSNQENAAYPLGLCAERTALFAAGAQYPDQIVVKLAVTVISQKGNINKPVPPCGSCRQVVYECETRYGSDIAVLLQGDEGEVYAMPSIKTILPLLFDAGYIL